MPGLLQTQFHVTTSMTETLFLLNDYDHTHVSSVNQRAILITHYARTVKQGQ